MAMIELAHYKIVIVSTLEVSIRCVLDLHSTRIKEKLIVFKISWTKFETYVLKEYKESKVDYGSKLLSLNKWNVIVLMLKVSRSKCL